jgi:hypothetical protein
MIRFRLTWLLLLAVAAVLFLVNWHCWRPGAGGAVGGKPRIADAAVVISANADWTRFNLVR